MTWGHHKPFSSNPESQEALLDQTTCNWWPLKPRTLQEMYICKPPFTPLSRGTQLLIPFSSVPSSLHLSSSLTNLALLSYLLTGNSIGSATVQAIIIKCITKCMQMWSSISALLTSSIELYSSKSDRRPYFKCWRKKREQYTQLHPLFIKHIHTGNLQHWRCMFSWLLWKSLSSHKTVLLWGYPSACTFLEDWVLLLLSCHSWGALCTQTLNCYPTLKLFYATLCRGTPFYTDLFNGGLVA